MPPHEHPAATDSARELIAAHGGRVTRTRVAVIEALQRSAHPLSHDEIGAALAADGIAHDRVTLYRDDKNLYINGVRFPMRRLQRGEEQQLWLGNLSVTDRDYETELDAAATSIDRLVRDLSDNLFVSEEDKKSVAQYVSIVRKEIAWARVDMRKLRYGDE